MNTLIKHWSYTIMTTANGFSYRVRLLTNLGILVWVNIIKTTSIKVRHLLALMLIRAVPDIRSENGLLASTYEAMRAKLRDSLREIEEKTQQLEESWDELKGSRDLLQTTIDSINADLIVIDRDLRITQVNRSVRERYGEQQIIGRHCYEVTHKQEHPCQSTECICPLPKVWETGKPEQVVHVHDVGENNGGERRYLQIVVSPLFSRNGEITQVVELSEDITKNKEQENRILETNRALRALNAIAVTVSESLSLDYVLNTAIDWVMETTRVEIGGILLLDGKTQTLSYRASRGLSQQYLKSASDVPMGEGVSGLVALEGIPMIAVDALREPRISGRRLVAEEGIRGLLAVPLKSKERVVGVLIIGSHAPHTFSPQEVQLLTALGHQLGIAIENAQLYQEVQLREQARAELLRQFIRVQEDERRRVARELHDVTSQALATLAVRVETLNSIARSAPAEMDTLLDEIRSLLSSTSREVHSLIYDLRPSLLDDLGLPAAIRSCAHNLLETAGVEVHVELAGAERRLPSEMEIAVFRITQEAITNVSSHSKAESTYVSLEFKDKSVVVQVEDDGIGFNLLEVLSSAHARQSMGLLGMKERAELLGGVLNIYTQPGKGTRVVIEIPFNWEQNDAQNKSAVGG